MGSAHCGAGSRPEALAVVVGVIFGGAPLLRAAQVLLGFGPRVALACFSALPVLAVLLGLAIAGRSSRE